MYLLQTVAVMIANRRGTIPAAEPGTFDLGRARVPVACIVGLICFTLVCAALIFLPQFAGNGYVFLGLVVLAGALGRHRAAQAAGHRRGRTGLRQDPHCPEIC